MTETEIATNDITFPVINPGDDEEPHYEAMQHPFYQSARENTRTWAVYWMRGDGSGRMIHEDLMTQREALELAAQKEAKRLTAHAFQYRPA